MRLGIILLLYNLLLPFALAVLLPASVLKMRRRGGYGAKFWQRFGWFDAATRARLAAGQGRAWWLHAVSVGEVNVARKLIAERVRMAPGVPVVLSVTTSTGHAVAVKDAPPELTVIYSPVDLLPVPWLVLRLVQPVRLVLVEAEVWPNLVALAARFLRIPVVLANARLSPRSERRYRRLRGLVAPVFGLLDRVLVQDAADTERWAGLGVPRERIILTGSVKYDGTHAGSDDRAGPFRGLLRGLWGEGERPVILAASTHAGEEEVLVRALLPVLRAFPETRLAVAPRHAERREEVREALARAGCRVVLRSALPEPGERDEADAVLVIDSTGELRDWQALASLVIIGKSFLTRGGQNPAEAIAAGVPVVCGPHMENFEALMAMLRRADAVDQVPDLEALTIAVERILRDPGPARAAAARGRAALESHRGAAARSVEVIAALVSPDGPAT